MVPTATRPPANTATRIFLCARDMRPPLLILGLALSAPENRLSESPAAAQAVAPREMVCDLARPSPRAPPISPSAFAVKIGIQIESLTRIHSTSWRKPPFCTRRARRPLSFPGDYAFAVVKRGDIANVGMEPISALGIALIDPVEADGVWVGNSPEALTSLSNDSRSRPISLQPLILHLDRAHRLAAIREVRQQVPP
jgi:hypothetical protein